VATTATGSAITLDSSEVEMSLGRIMKALPEVEAEAVRKGSDYTWKVTQRRVPEKMGALKASGRRVVYRTGPGEVAVSMSYGFPAKVRGNIAYKESTGAFPKGSGGGPESYAAAIHEHSINTQYSPYTWFIGRKKGKRSGGTAIELNYTKGGSGNKYLEGPVNENRKEFVKTTGLFIKFRLQQLAAARGKR
tara:strand:+ start:1418 stop:1990 length:573 start_codon:yes stop_codon:yes gene_type:complete